MPKVYDTKKEKAIKLLKLLEKGPDWDLMFFHEGDLSNDIKHKIVKDFKCSYRLWSQTWIINDLKKLIPQLRDR